MDWKLPSQDLDKLLGFRVHEIEKDLHRQALQKDPGGNHHTWGASLHGGNQTWVGLHPETIQTPYAELIRICQKLELKTGEIVVDLGAGYGRLGIVLRELHPGVEFLGIECVPERVEEGKRVHGLNLVQGDLTHSEFLPPEANHYFIYDFGKVSHIRDLLKKLSMIADRKKITITGRGKGIRSLISHEFLWLTPFHEEENFSLYSV